MREANEVTMHAAEKRLVAQHLRRVYANSSPDIINVSTIVLYYLLLDSPFDMARDRYIKQSSARFSDEGVHLQR